ncbi:MAG TPA: gephyrin-like molybdotransferase receptor GlpR [Nocardia sp.]|nr:gephyrin-like molybdotransferase receptor GlpR [Nocardia sp.]HLS76017.1 gephyrin-like molybdotransferase receptor GlpR [Nocardia sp.]
MRRKRFHSDDAEDRMTIPADEKVSEIDDLAELLDENTLEDSPEEHVDRRGRVAPARSARAEAPPRESDSTEAGRERHGIEIDDSDDGPRRERTIRRGGARRNVPAPGDSDRDRDEWPGDAATADDSTAGDFTADDVTGADIEADDAFGDTDSDEGGAERDEDARAAADAGVQADAGDSDAERDDPAPARDGDPSAGMRQITARIPPARTKAPVRVPDPGYGAPESEDEEFDADSGATERADLAGRDSRDSGRRGEKRRKGRRGSRPEDRSPDDDRRNSSRDSEPDESAEVEFEAEKVDESRADDAEFVPSRRGRGGYDPEADAIARAARYTFRQRAVLALMLTTLATGALGLIFTPLFWYGSGLSFLVLATYLAYLRRQVRMEEEIRRRRAARLRRRREFAEDDDFDDQPLDADERVRIATGGMDRATARALRRRSTVLDVDDEDPLFEHLEPFDPATARALRRRTGVDSRRRAAGEQRQASGE